jgi:D-xylose transport system permease protein
VTTIRSVRQTVAGLSGGQRQSVAVAKAVMWNSRVVILDEPTAALGVAQTKQVLDLVARLGEQGLAVVLISHNLHDIFQVADSITVLRLGQNVKEFKRRETNQQEVVEAITAGPALAGARPVRGGRRMSAATAPPPAAEPGAPAANTVSAYAQRWWTDVKSGELGSLPIVVGLILIAIVFQTQNDRFLTASNFVNLIVQTAPYAVIAMGVTFALLLGEIDLSIGFVSGVGGVLTRSC